MNNVKLKCSYCECEFSRRKNVHEHSVLRGGVDYKPTCSVSCSSNLRRSKDRTGIFSCANCGLSFERRTRDAQRSANVFCSSSCSAIFNNKLSPKRNISSDRTGSCQNCHCDIVFRPRKNGSFFKRKFCDSCRVELKESVLNYTKGDFFLKSKNWQSARSSIQRHARRVYLSSEKPKSCFVCGYSLHFEVCHIQDVASFDDSVIISKINCIDNLTALCPTHHWEFDNGHLKLEKPSFDGF